MAYDIRYMPIASEQLRALPTRDQRTVVDSVEVQLRHDPEVETRNRKRMRPNNLATWELRIGDLRVFYEIEPLPPAGEKPALLTVVILAVGLKQGNRLWIGDEEVEL